MKHLKKIWNDEKGSALVLTMMIFVVLSILGAALSVVTMGSLRLGDKSREYNSAYYIAEAGANIAYEEIMGEIGKTYEISASESIYYTNISNKMSQFNENYGNLYFNLQFGSQPEANVKVRKESENQYKIESTGEVNSKTRTVEKEVNFPLVEKSKPVAVPIFLKDDVLIARKEFDYSKMESYTGGIRMNDPTFDFSPYEDLVNEFPSVPENVETISFNKEKPLKITDNIKINNMSIINDLTVNIGDKDVYIVVDNLTVAANIEVEGTGRLYFYTTNSVIFKNGAKVNENGNLNQINFIHAGTSSHNRYEVKFEGSSPIEINGSFFIEEARVVNDKKANTTIRGLILFGGYSGHENKKEVLIDNDSTLSAVIIAPYDDINIFNHSTFHGVIVADEIEAGNKTGAHYPIEDPNGNFKDFAFGPSPNASGDVSTDELINTKPAIEK